MIKAKPHSNDYEESHGPALQSPQPATIQPVDELVAARWPARPQISDATTTGKERPALVPNVELVGEMPETGFEEQQYLVRRDGKFVQLTELLYRVAELSNGERTLDDIAEKITETTDWAVEAEHVRLLVQKLIPLGIIARSDGSPPSSDEAPARPETGSALAFSMKLKVIGPRIIEPITRVLQVLYTPPILIPMLIAVAIAHGWVYFAHGMTASIGQVLYRPELLLVVLPIMLIAGVFHEFGHASALRYGGGKVPAMGAGLYLIFPALYTDTSDSYRLGRWARVRTDLGGFYFHLIFALGIIGLYMVTGQEFLLLIVLIINLDVAYQLLPFVRLDGYWALADLTGIPDFFSQMGPFLASVLPRRNGKAGKLPALKPWVRTVFSLYAILAIPVLALLLLVAIVSVPFVTAVTWDSLLWKTVEFSGAQSRGDLLSILAVIGQMLILALPLLALAYMLFRVVRAPVRALWRWSSSSPTRRVAGATIGTGTLALVAVLWAPILFLEIRVAPAGIEQYEVVARAHVETPVSYQQTPPVGGNHAPIWQNCGFYDVPIRNENGVHSMEHGAVWITYRPDLPKEQVIELHGLARSRTHLLVSPYPDLPAPIVASAWGRQFRLDSADDPRLEQFVSAYRLSSQAPESGGLCSEGVGGPK